MLKHDEITLRRVRQYLEHRIRPGIVRRSTPLSLSFLDAPYRTDEEARAASGWVDVDPGFAYGPAFRVFWFRLRGVVPDEELESDLDLHVDLGTEATLWRDGSPYRGFDAHHRRMRIPEGWRDRRELDLFVQAYTTDPDVSVHHRARPRRAKVATVREARWEVVDREREALARDVEFALDLVESLEPANPSRAAILRALNDLCNHAGSLQPNSIGRVRKALRDLLASLPGEMRHTVVPVGHAHLDTAWLWPLEITRLKMAHTAANQLELIERYPEYVFVHSQAVQYEWLEREYPVLFEKVRGAIARKQWEPVGGMWVEPDCNLIGGESLVRQFLYGRRYFEKKLGVLPVETWLPDAFGFCASLPQILNLFGVSHFLTQKISWNQTNAFPHHTFRWRGIDGSSVLAHFPPADTYCGDCTPRELVRSVRNYRDHGRADFSLYVFGYGDGGGGPTEEHLERLRRARLSGELPVIESGKRVAEFFPETAAKSRDLLTWTGELYLELHRGTYTSQAANKRANRECEFLLRDAEWLACFTNGFPADYPAEVLEEAWKLVLLNQFHDILPGSSVREVYVDSAADYERVRRLAGDIVDTCLRRIAERMDSSELRRPYAIFQNAPLGTQVELPWAEPTAPQSVTCSEGRLPTQLVEAFGERRLIFPTPIEALESVAIVDLSPQPPTVRPRLKVGARRLENEQWVVRFDAHGNIISIGSLEDRSVEFVRPGSLANLFQLYDDAPLAWSAWDIDPFSLETGRDLVRSDSFEIVERGPVRVAAEVVKTFGKSRIRQRISLGPTPGIRFDTEVDWHETDTLLKVAFPANVNATRATFEIAFGNVERPTHANTSWDAARFEVNMQKWVDVSEGGYGLAVLNDGKYGVGVWDGVIRLSLLRSPKAPDPQCDMGRHRFTYVVLPHFDQYRIADVVAAAYALNAPARAIPLEPRPGQAGELPKFVSTNSRNLVIESVKKAEDSGRIVVRLYECHNTRGEAELYCARPVRSAYLALLDETPIEELEVVDGVVFLAYRPFQILTVLLEV